MAGSKDKCVIGGCGGSTQGLGLCRVHYSRWRTVSRKTKLGMEDFIRHGGPGFRELRKIGQEQLSQVGAPPAAKAEAKPVESKPAAEPMIVEDNDGAARAVEQASPRFEGKIETFSPFREAPDLAFCQSALRLLSKNLDAVVAGIAPAMDADVVRIAARAVDQLAGVR